MVIRIKHTLLLISFLMLAQTSLVKTAPAQTLKEIDLFGTSQITAEQVKQKLGSDIEKFVKAYVAGDNETYGNLYKQIVAAIRGMGSFAFARVSLIQYYSDGKPIYVTIDLVDEKDKATRMTFLPAPTGEYADPDGLFAQWEKYEKKGWELMNKGALDFKEPKCPAFHCIFGFEHPELKPYEEAFRLGARKHKTQLFEILKNDKKEEHRGKAAYLLAHIESAEELVRALAPAIRDSSSYVRNNVMRVLALLVKDNKTVDVPLAEILQAINFPDTTDRNKSLYVLDGLADRPANREQIARQVGHLLVKLLRLAQPNNHDPAYSILQKISGEKFGERDYAAWERWVEKRGIKGQ